MKSECRKCGYVLNETPWTTASERKFESHECLTEFEKGRKRGAVQELERLLILDSNTDIFLDSDTKKEIKKRLELLKKWW